MITMAYICKTRTQKMVRGGVSRLCIQTLSHVFGVVSVVAVRVKVLAVIHVGGRSTQHLTEHLSSYMRAEVEELLASETAVFLALQKGMTHVSCKLRSKGGGAHKSKHTSTITQGCSRLTLLLVSSLRHNPPSVMATSCLAPSLVTSLSCFGLCGKQAIICQKQDTRTQVLTQPRNDRLTAADSDSLGHNGKLTVLVVAVASQR